MKLIPAIDLKDNKCVRLTRGNINSAEIFNDNPINQAKYFEKLGCKRLHIVDLDAAFGNQNTNYETIIKIRKEINIPIQLGGGIRDEKSLKNYIDKGINYIIIGSLAVERSDLILGLSENYIEKIYFAMDLLENKVMTKGWKHQSRLKNNDIFDQFNQTKLRGYVLTDVSRDGMLQGLNIDLISENLNLSKKDLIVGGGLSSYQDLKNLCQLKSKILEGVIVGKSYYVGKIDIKKGMEILNNNA